MVEPVKVKQSQIDTDSNGSIDADEWKNWGEKNKVKSDANVILQSDAGVELMRAQFGEVQKGLSEDGSLLSFSADANEPTIVSAKDVQAMEEKMQEIFKKIQLAEETKNEKMAVEQKAKLAELLQSAQKLQGQGAKFDSARMAQMAKAIGLSEGSGEATPQVLMNAQSNSGTGSGAGGGGGALGNSKAQQTSGFSSPSGWGAQTTGGSTFSSDAYLQSLGATSSIMDSWDQISKNQNRGKQLMQLFYYFAKMAESGDMGAMYQFMKFITYIVSKDKAKQQIEMGKKLIQLQDQSRQWTNKLMETSTSTDANANNELMKTMTIVKSETDAIATSQKLISQMMEEFSQVVETLTNVTKSALETAGRIARRVSTMN